MAKTRINKNAKRRLYEKQQYAMATQVRILAEQLVNQSQLDTFLLQQSDVTKRRLMFEFCKPFITFANPTCPSPLDPTSRIIRP